MFLSDIFNAIVFQPLYNALIFITNLTPGANIGLAIVILTVVVKFIILPLSHKSIKTQAEVRNLDPKIKKIKEKHKDNQQEQAAQIMKLYKEHGINPFSGCVLTIIQIPIIFGLYWVFWKGLSTGIINNDILYAFVQAPESLNFNFLGFIDLRENGNILFAFLAGATQFFQLQLSFPKIPQKTEDKNKSKTFTDELKKSMASQARYVLPVVIGVVSLGFPAAVPLYWATSNTFSITHELFVKRKAQKLVEGESPQA